MSKQISKDSLETNMAKMY